FFDYLLFEHGKKYDSSIARVLCTAAFIMLWYRFTLFGKEQTSYGKLFKHMRKSSVFSSKMFFASLGRVVITTAAMIIPTMAISLFMIYHHTEAGGEITGTFLKTITQQSAFMVSLMLSPIFVRLSFFSIAVSLGRATTTFREVWSITKGYTGVLWHLIFRAFLSLALYNYFVMSGIKRMVESYELHYFWTNLLVTLPAIFLIYIMLAIVIVANSEAFKILFNITEDETP
ncbi:MAG: hypothetical protein P8I94_06995, partial [Emcibacteraceae bacterium]|nr:hypothetical protein [Emcibacteraceae bacterium]